MAELEEVKAALSHQVPPGSALEVLIRKCFRIALDACSKRRRGGKPRNKAAPEDSASSASESEAARAEASSEATANEIPETRNQQRAEEPPSRYISVAVRREVWDRDGGRCAFVGSNGKRCGSRERLEFHHLVPHARGGEATAEWIELRCRPHNLYEARLDFGDEVMDRFRRGRPRRQDAAAAREGLLFAEG